MKFNFGKERQSGSDSVDFRPLEPSLFRYVVRNTLPSQLLLLTLIALSLPVEYALLQVSKFIVDDALTGGLAPVTISRYMPESVFGWSLNPAVFYLWVLCLLFLLLVIISGGFKYLTNVYRGVIGEKALRRLRFDLYTRILRFPLAHFKRTSPGKIIPMVTSETETLGGYIGDAMALPAFEGGRLITFLSFIFLQDWTLGIAAILLIPLQIWFVPKLQRKVNALTRRRINAAREFSDGIGESVGTVSEIHANNTSYYERALAGEKLERIQNIRIDIFKLKYFIKFFNNFIAQLTPFLFYLIGGTMLITGYGDLTLGSLVTVIWAHEKINPHWKALLKFYEIVQDTSVKYQQITEKFNVPGMLNARLLDNTVELQELRLRGEFIASNVHYGEDDQLVTLHGVTLKTDLTEQIAIVGMPGSGKEDLGRLLSRLVLPSRGRLTVSGHDVCNLSQTVTGRRIGYVSGTVQLGAGSLWDNVIYVLKSKHPKKPAAPDTVFEQEPFWRSTVNDKSNEHFTKDADLDWIDYDSAGVDDINSLRVKVLQLLDLAGLDKAVYQFGMQSKIDSDHEIVDVILHARQHLRKLLTDHSMAHLVTRFDVSQYNTSVSVAENIVFGSATNNEFDPHRLESNALIIELMQDAGLDKEFLVLGYQAAQILADVFADVAPDDELFLRFSFFDGNDLPDLRRIVSMTSADNLDQLDEKSTSLLRAVPFQLIVDRHRLGLIDDQVQTKVLGLRRRLRERLGEENGRVIFFDEQKYNSAMSVQDNILFGHVTAGGVDSRSQVEAMIQETLESLGILDAIRSLGLNFKVGTGGARLTVGQRQRMGIVRALIKNPDILVINNATNSLTAADEAGLINRVRTYRKNKCLFWILSRSQAAACFEKIVVLDEGTVVCQGSDQELRESCQQYVAMLEGIAG